MTEREHILERRIVALKRQLKVLTKFAKKKGWGRNLNKGYHTATTTGLLTQAALDQLNVEQARAILHGPAAAAIGIPEPRGQQVIFRRPAEAPGPEVIIHEVPPDAPPGRRWNWDRNAVGQIIGNQLQAQPQDVQHVEVPVDRGWREQAEQMGRQLAAELQFGAPYVPAEPPEPAQD